MRGPLQAMRLQQHAPRVDVVGVQRGPHAEVGDTRQRLVGQAVHQHREDAAGGRFPVLEAQVEGAKTVVLARRRRAQRPAQLAAVDHVARDRVRTPQQRVGVGHAAFGQRLAHGRAGHPQAVHLVAVHARHVEPVGFTGRIEHGVVAGALGAEAEVVTHQYVFHAQRADQDVFDEGLWCQRGEPGIERQHHTLVDTAAFELLQLVAQRGDAGGGELWLVV
ncbi:hypothetical protein D9M69_562750 [compost metagenome]